MGKMKPTRINTNAPDATCPAHAQTDHPKIPKEKIGILLANLGTPDATDYWSMRRYLNEFLSDERVIDYPKWKWQPILQGIVLTFRPVKIRRGLSFDLERGGK